VTLDSCDYQYQRGTGDAAGGTLRDLLPGHCGPHDDNVIREGRGRDRYEDFDPYADLWSAMASMEFAAW